MNKKILAVVISGLLSPSMATYADEGNVILYGNANLAVEQVDNGVVDADRVSTNTSVFGIKGTEPLGNGLKAVFLFDAFLNLDDGNGTTGTLFANARDSWVGLAGTFGTVALGTQSQPFKTATSKLDLFVFTIADYASIIDNAQGFNLYDTGIPNSIIYFGPKVGGFSGHAQYGFDEVDGISADRWGLQVNYTNDPWYATYAHVDRGDFDIDGGGGLFSIADFAADKIGVSYTFLETTTFNVIYEDLRADDSAAASEHEAVYLGLAHKLGKTVFKGAYAKAGDSEAVGADDGADYFAIGVSHFLSKRTEVYGLYARTDNDDGGFYGLGQTGSSAATRAGAAGEQVDAFALGIKHGF